MKIIAVDIGSKRIGIATSDPLGITAGGLKVLEETNLQKLAEEIIRLSKGEAAEEIVVGLPLNMNGSYGPQAKRAAEFAELLRKGINIPVKLWDERLTTIQAERAMIKADVSRKKRRKKIDKVAAQLILQSYLNSIRNM